MCLIKLKLRSAVCRRFRGLLLVEQGGSPRVHSASDCNPVSMHDLDRPSIGSRQIPINIWQDLGQHKRCVREVANMPASCYWVKSMKCILQLRTRFIIETDYITIQYNTIYDMVLLASFLQD